MYQQERTLAYFHLMLSRKNLIAAIAASDAPGADGFLSKNAKRQPGLPPGNENGMKYADAYE